MDHTIEIIAVCVAGLLVLVWVLKKL